MFDQIKPDERWAYRHLITWGMWFSFANIFLKYKSNPTRVETLGEKWATNSYKKNELLTNTQYKLRERASVFPDRFEPKILNPKFWNLTKLLDRLERGAAHPIVHNISNTIWNGDQLSISPPPPDIIGYP